MDLGDISYPYQLRYESALFPILLFMTNVHTTVIALFIAAQFWELQTYTSILHWEGSYYREVSAGGVVIMPEIPTLPWRISLLVGRKLSGTGCLNQSAELTVKTWLKYVVCLLGIFEIIVLGLDLHLLVKHVITN